MMGREVSPLINRGIKSYWLESQPGVASLLRISAGGQVAAADSTDVIAALGYTPSDDANTVKTTGDQNVGGVKTFTDGLAIGSIDTRLKRAAAGTVGAYLADGVTLGIVRAERLQNAASDYVRCSVGSVIVNSLTETAFSIGGTTRYTADAVNFYPNSTGRNMGTTGNRWNAVNSVDGSFSGTVQALRVGLNTTPDASLPILSQLAAGGAGDQVKLVETAGHNLRLSPRNVTQIDPTAYTRWQVGLDAIPATSSAGGIAFNSSSGSMASCGVGVGYAALQKLGFYVSNATALAEVGYFNTTELGVAGKLLVKAREAISVDANGDGMVGSGFNKVFFNRAVHLLAGSSLVDGPATGLLLRSSSAFLFQTAAGGALANISGVDGAFTTIGNVSVNKVDPTLTFNGTTGSGLSSAGEIKFLGGGGSNWTYSRLRSYITTGGGSGTGTLQVFSTTGGVESLTGTFSGAGTLFLGNAASGSSAGNLVSSAFSFSGDSYPVTARNEGNSTSGVGYKFVSAGTTGNLLDVACILAKKTALTTTTSTTDLSFMLPNAAATPTEVVRFKASGAVSIGNADTVLKRVGASQLGVYAANETALGTLRAVNVNCNGISFFTDATVTTAAGQSVGAVDGSFSSRTTGTAGSYYDGISNPANTTGVVYTQHAGLNKWVMGSAGRIKHGPGNMGITDNAGLHLTGLATTYANLLIDGIASQTADFVTMRNSSAVVKAKIDVNGIVHSGGAPTVSLASWLSGTMAGYFTRSGLATSTIAVEHQGATSEDGGGFLGLYSNDGSAMSSGDRLGGFFLGGYNGTSMKNASMVHAYAEETWSSMLGGSNLVFATTPNGSITRTDKAKLNNAGNFTVLGNVQQGYASLTESYRQRMSASGVINLETGDGAGAWQTGYRQEYNVSGVRAGFYGATPVAQQSGDIGTGLVALGLFSSTTASGSGPTLGQVLAAQPPQAGM